MSIDELRQQALSLHRAGNLAGAEQLYRTILAAHPDHAPTLHLLGVLAFQDRRGDEALALLQQAIARDPTQASFHHSLGESYRGLGQWDAAIDCFEEALRLDANLFAAHYSLGLLAAQQQDWKGAVAALCEAVRLKPEAAEAHDHLAGVYFELGRREEALDELRRVVALRGNSAEAHVNLGNVQQEMGRLDEAIASFQSAIRLRPDLTGAHFNLGNALRSAGRLDEAAASYRQALRLAPDFAQAHNNLGAALRDRGDNDAAAVAFREAVRLAPLSAEVHHNLGKLMKHTGKLAEAQALLSRAIELDPDYAPSHFSLGGTLLKLNQTEAARRSYLEALRLRPNYAEAHCGLGMVCREAGEFDRAISEFDAAISIDSELAEAHVNRGMLLLSRGDFAAGWSELEWRWRVSGALQPAPGPAWNGAPLAGRTIMLYPEQGLGDALQFIRYAPLVNERGGRVIVACVKRLIPILSTCRGVEEFYPADGPFPPYDVHAPLVSLPRVFQTDEHSIPALVPYLSARGELIEHWRGQLPEDSFCVGINWQGNPAYGGDYWRSMPLGEFAPLAEVEGVRLFSLQKGAGVEQLANAPFEVEDLGSRLDLGDAAFCDTAAVIGQLDLVITSDTAVAHLAGALGAPVWVALPFAPDWRWLLDREDSPWYPTMRLFRQSLGGGWKAVFERMAGELRRLVANASQ
jgi:tetratricopeptide (TPR) repeat protein